MANLINKLIICVFLGVSLSSFVSADDLLFEDEVLFEEPSQEFDEWSDDSDLFGDEIKNVRPFAWLNIGVAQKWGFNPASDWNTTKERTELILGTTGSVSDDGYEVDFEKLDRAEDYVNNREGAYAPSVKMLVQIVQVAPEPEY